jgi:hypothetical protein
VYSESYRVVSGIGRSATGNEEDDPENSQDESEGEDEEGKKKPKRRVRDYMTTIEKNVERLNASKLDKQHDMDPFFKTISQMFDAGSSKSLMMSLLQADKDLTLALDRHEVDEVLTDQGPNMVEIGEYALNPSVNEGIPISDTLEKFLTDNSQHLPEYTIQRELFGPRPEEMDLAGEDENSDYFEEHDTEIDVV